MEAMSANSTSTQRFAWGRWMRTAYRWAIAAFAALAGLGLTAPPASAQGLRPVIFTPASPVAGEVIEAAFDSNICEGIVDGPNEADIIRMGTNIDVIVDGTVADDVILCFFTPARQRFVLGALPPGRYMVRIVIRSLYPPFPLFPPSASGAVVVAAALIPASSGLTRGVHAMLTLFFGLLVIAARKSAVLVIAKLAHDTLAAGPSQVPVERQL
jgi:hypothetical protein